LEVLDEGKEWQKKKLKLKLSSHDEETRIWLKEKGIDSGIMGQAAWQLTEDWLTARTYWLSKAGARDVCWRMHRRELSKVEVKVERFEW
jgi:hypothetical protein